MASQQGGGGARPKTRRQSPGSMQQASASTKEGWLFVPGTRKTLFGLVKKRRYCVLEGHTGLVVYKDDTKRVITDVCHLRHARCVTATAPSSYMFEIRMTGDEAPLFLASRDQADMLDWIHSLKVAILFTFWAAGPASSPSHGRGTHQAENSTDPATCQQPSTSHTESPGLMQKASTSTKEGWLFVREEILFEPGEKQERRYCVLEGHTWLVVYKDDTKSVITDLCHLPHASDVTATVPSSYVFEIRMTGDEPPFVLVSRDKADMMDWIYSLNVAIVPHRAARTASTPSHGRGTNQAEKRTDPGTCQQPSTSQSEREFLNAWFPHLDSAVYIIPPHHVDTVHVTKQYTRGGDMIDVLKTQQEIDMDSTKHREVSDVVHIDRALKKVHYCMNKIKDKAARQNDVMVIFTQAKSNLFGAGSRSLYAGAAARNMNSDETEPLVLQEDLVLEEDFVDLLVINRQHGVMMGAIIRQTEEDPGAVQEELRKATTYLKQAGDVVRRCVLGDLASQPAVHQTILLPHTTRDCLEEALRDMEDLQELEVSLGVGPGRGVGRYCLCADDMADDRRLHAWWSTCLTGNQRGDLIMNDATYATLVARFSVPLTTVYVYLNREPRLQLWTQGHFVQAVGKEHGRHVSRLALFRQQFELLEETPADNDDDIKVLIGGPGTGKSCILIVRGSYWMRGKGCDTVFVVQTSDDGTAASFMVRHQLEETVGQAVGSVQLVNMAGGWNRQGGWTEEGQKKLDALCQHAVTHGNIHILADEVDGHVMAEIYKALKQRHITVSLWAAGVKVTVPDDMKRYVHHLTQPLRSPPSVVREVEQADDMTGGQVPAYTAPPVAPPSDGPPVLRVDHLDSEGGDRQGHEGFYPWKCERCGQLVADILTSLRVGCHDHAPHGQSGLAFSDVFVLGIMDCGTDRTDDNRYSPAPFIRGLESRGVPTRKVAHNDTAAVRQLAEMTSAPSGGQRAAGRGRDEAVTVAHENTVWGLERPVVVYLDGDNVVSHLPVLPGLNIEVPIPPGLHDADRTGRLRSVSRSTAQLIWVKRVT